MRLVTGQLVAGLITSAAVLALLVGCPGGDDDDDTAADDDDTTAPPWSYPLDDTLRLNQLQAVGTHNSYHLETGETPVVDWDYSHRPLDEQLGVVGVRQFELDVSRTGAGDTFEVYHVPFIDEGTTCRALVDCLATMKDWSDRNPAHHPFVTLIELKDPYDAATADDYLAALEAELRSVWPDERLIRPDDVQRDAANLRDGLAADGWPTLGELRGRALFVLHTGGGFRDRYTDGGTAGRNLFPDAGGNVDAGYAAVHSMNDPVGSHDAIQAVVDAGHLVRTRADSGSVEAWALDYGRFESALDSGAHFLSTDYPEPHYETGYVVEIPGGTPSRCNPRVAPGGCTAEAIEDPGFIGG